MPNFKIPDSRLDLAHQTKGAVISVVEERHVHLSRQAARKAAEKLGFKTAQIGHIVTCVSELANNLVFHTDRGGSINIKTIFTNNATGLEIISTDDGPGIPNIDLAVTDGFSTGGGLGGGLPGVIRLMDEFEIESLNSQGTIITARKWKTHI